MTENDSSRRIRTAGALHSDLNIVLHTTYAIDLWNGREVKKDDKVLRFIGMPEVISRIKVANRNSETDNPYADAMLFGLENMLATARLKIDTDIACLDEILGDLPGTITVSDVYSRRPLKIGVYSRSPMGYRCVWLLVGYDHLVKKTFQVFHYGLISRQKQNDLLRINSHEVRQIYNFVRRYRPVPVTRGDIIRKTSKGLEAIQLLGEPDSDILYGKKRSSFSAPLILEELCNDTALSV